MTGGSVHALVGLGALMTAAVRAVGPAALGGRVLPEWLMRAIPLLAPALLTALVCASALVDGQDLAIGPKTAGVAVAGLILLRGGPIVVAVTAAAVVTALLRAL
jgi:branched-subunit amino acid transport protein